LAYTTEANIRSLTGLGTADIGTSDMAVFLKYADADVERYTKKVWTGQQTKEFLGRGDGTTDVWFTSLKPIVASSGGTAPTDDESKVSVYLGGSASALGTALYTLLGAEGRITFSQIPDTDEKVEVTYYYRLDPIEQAATFFAGAYCFHRLGKALDKAKLFEQRAIEILREFGRRPRLIKSYT